jgi:hypothetical protein
MGTPDKLPDEIEQSLLQILFILLPCLAVHAGRSFSLQPSEAFFQQFDCQMVQQRGEADLLIFLCCPPHTLQSIHHGWFARRRSRVGLHVFSLVRPLPSSSSAAAALFATFAGTIGRPDSSVAFVSGFGFFFLPESACSFRHNRGLPVPVQKVSQRAWGL